MENLASSKNDFQNDTGTLILTGKFQPKDLKMKSARLSVAAWQVILT